MRVDGCFTCRNTAAVDVPIRERIVRTEQWRVAHATHSAIVGWLILAPVEHVTALDELSSDAAEQLGPMLSDLTRALKFVTGCVKTYVVLLAEKPGFAHLHFHVVPRAADLAEQFRGPRVFALLEAADGQRVPNARQDEIALALQEALRDR